MFTLVKLLVVGCAAFVYYDATKQRIGKVEGAAFPNFRAGGWALGTLFLCLVFFPFYLYKRAALIERAQAQPREAARAPSPSPSGWTRTSIPTTRDASSPSAGCTWSSAAPRASGTRP